MLGSDGLWNVMSAIAIKPLAKLTFLSAANKAQRTYGLTPNEDHKEQEILTADTLSKKVCDEARLKWEEVRFLSLFVL